MEDLNDFQMAILVSKPKFKEFLNKVDPILKGSIGFITTTSAHFLHQMKMSLMAIMLFTEPGC